MANFYSSTLGDMSLNADVITSGYLDDLAQITTVCIVSTMLSNAISAISVQLSSKIDELFTEKQDNLIGNQLSALDAVVAKRQTSMAFDTYGADISSFDFVGIINSDVFKSVGLKNENDEWVKYPFDVQIGNAVTALQSTAFKDCSALTSIAIPDSVSYIGMQAFANCISLENASFCNGIDTMSDKMLSGCISLKNIIIPNSVAKIDEYAFSQCSSLTSLYISDTITRIDDYAFTSCFSLSSVTLGSSVSAIGQYAFSDCSSLQRIIVRDKTQEEAENLLSDANLPEDCDIVTYVMSNNAFSERTMIDALSSANIDKSTSMNDITLDKIQQIIYSIAQKIL